MIGISDIYKILDQQKYAPETERVPLHKAIGRLLPETVYAEIDSPPFDKSSMDGWAVPPGDGRGPWKIMETVAAGTVSTREPLKTGECAAIMTGARIPEGCGRVIRIEYTRREGDMVFLERDEDFENIIRRGDNMKSGDIVLTPRRLEPKDTGILASMGIAEISAARSPRVGIITTGSEIIEPGNPLAAGQIYNSNGPQLTAHAVQAGCIPKYYGITPDNEEALERVIRKGLEESDILVLSGGVSMGEFDFVPGTLERLGVKKSFHKASVKPGKPIWFGRSEKCFVFGLPGNPLSTFVLFEVFVKHLIYRFCGMEYKPLGVEAVLGEPMGRKTADRTEFLPVAFRDGRVYPVVCRSSSHINSIAGADGLVIMDIGVQNLEKGKIVYVRLL